MIEPDHIFDARGHAKLNQNTANQEPQTGLKKGPKMASDDCLTPSRMRARGKYLTGEVGARLQVPLDAFSQLYHTAYMSMGRLLLIH